MTLLGWLRRHAAFRVRRRRLGSGSTVRGGLFAIVIATAAP
jgi:hypothetical protein